MTDPYGPPTAAPAPPPPGDPGVTAVEVQRLTKRYGDRSAVADLSFSVRTGSVTGFLGPNGAGKTTTLRMLLGLARPTFGRALVFGRPYDELEDPARTVGASLEVSGFHPGRSGRDHLRALAAMARLPATRVDEALAVVELTGAADRRAGTYSMGMRQRLALAAALLGDPQLLVLDEPANGLDPQGIRWLRDFLRTRAAEGRTVLVSSHVLAEVAQTVDDVVVIAQGRSAYQGSIRDLTERAGSGTVDIATSDPDRLAQAVSGAGGAVVQRAGESLTVRGVARRDLGALAAREGLVVYGLTDRTASLEDVFLQLTAPAAPEARR